MKWVLTSLQAGPAEDTGLTAVQVAELIVAGLLLLGGVRSLATWLRRDYQAESILERLLYTLHVTARVALWPAFAGFFVGYALVDEPQDIRWFLLVPICLAGVQFLTGLALSRLPESDAKSDASA